MDSYLVVLTTVGAEGDAERIAEALVAAHLAACVNIIGPIRSVYFWEERVQRNQELLLVIKTRAAVFADLEARLKTLHPYQTPEIVALPVAAGAAAYLAWLDAATRP